ncbi:MAG: ABC transporter substrate-binding protein [Halobacteriaceae archaeon]
MPGHGTDSSDESRSELSRRNLLATVGAGSVAGVAGCSGNGGGDDSTPAETGGSGGIADKKFNAFYFANPPDDLYFNPFGPVAQGMGLYHWAMMFTGVGLWDMLNPERAMMGILEGHPRHTDPIEDGTATFKIRDDLTWHNGDSYTAKDYETGRMMKLYLAQSTGGEKAIPYTDVRAIDDTTVEVDMRDPSTPHDPWWNTMYGANLHHSCCTISNGPMWVKHDEWSDWRQRYEDAASKSEMESITQEIRSVTRPFEETIGYGPFKIKEISGQTVVYEPWEEWNGLVAVNWPDVESGTRVGKEEHQKWVDEGMTAELTFYSEQSVAGQAALGGDLDYVRLSSAAQGRDLKNQGWKKPPRTGRVYAANTEVGFHVNFNHPALAKTKVRKALLHLMNQMQLSTIGYQNTQETSQQSPVPVPAPTGLSWGSVIKRLDTGAVKNNWSGYTVQSSAQDRATTLLQEAGLSKSGGNWQMENGDRFIITLKQSSEIPVEVSRAFKDRLESFGIKTEFTAIESTLVSKTLRSGDYDLFYDFDEGGMGWPGSEFQQGFGFLGQDYPWGGSATKKVNHPDQWEVPSEIGNPDSSTETVDVVPMIQKLNQSGNDHEAITRRLAWIFNQTVPSLVYGNGEYSPKPKDRRPVGQMYNADLWNAVSRSETYGLKIMGATGNPGYPQSRHHFGAFEPKME